MDFKTPRAKRALKAVLIISTFLTITFSFFNVSSTFQGLHGASLDHLVRVTPSRKLNKDIVIIHLDEHSIQMMEPILGRWPWPREIWSQIINYLNGRGAKGIFIDFLFTEYSSPPIEDKLDESDESFLNINNFSKVVYAYQLYQDKEETIEAKDDTFLKESQYPYDCSLAKAENTLIKPFEELAKRGKNFGFVNLTPDPDGIYRSVNTVKRYRGRCLKSFSLMFYDQKVVSYNQTFYPYHDAHALSLSLILESLSSGFSKLEENLIKDKYVFIGGSAVGIKDLKATSIGNIPGVNIHASLLSNYLNKDFVTKAGVVTSALIVFTFSILIIGFVCLSQKKLVICISITSFFLMLYGLSFILFKEFLIVIPLIPMLLAISFGLGLGLIYRIFIEEKDKRFLKEAFGNYISPELIDMMYESASLPSLGGNSGIRTAFFTDIQGFSSFSEVLSADDLVILINEYLTAMTDILIEEGGTLDKYEGDAIIAFFGAPVEQDDHGQRACRVACKMQQKLIELRQKWVNEGDRWPEIVHNMNMRIGINTGEIVTGNMGSKGRMNYTMMGDAVNLAARLESAAKQYGVFTLISEEVKDHIFQDFLIREIDNVIVVGRSKPVKIYELYDMNIDSHPDIERLFSDFENGLKLFRNRSFKEALKIFEETKLHETIRGFPHSDKMNPSLLYINRCKLFIKEEPTLNFDFTFALEEK